MDILILEERFLFDLPLEARMRIGSGEETSISGKGESVGAEEEGCESWDTVTILVIRRVLLS